MAEANLSNAALGLHPNARNLMGQEFGRLTVIAFTGQRKRGSLVWECECKCGNIARVSAKHLIGGTESCGCLLSSECMSARAKTHGMTKTPEWLAWKNMIGRCTKPSDRKWHDYGGRGIKVCERWLESFENFYADMGLRPSDQHSLDRYPDNDGNYCPENCRWATPIEQANNRRDNVLLTFQGETLSVAEWTRKLGFRLGLISDRLQRGWSVHDALTNPAD